MAAEPSLGPQIMHWMYVNLAAPDRTEYEPFLLTPEQQDFVYEFYVIGPSGSRVIRRGVYSRPKGSGKSPLLAAIAAAEALGPVVFDHWATDDEPDDEWGYRFDPGEPVGKRWRTIRTPKAQLSAVTEDQTANAWDPLLEMLGREAPVRINYPGLDPLSTFVALPGGGRIEFVTSSAPSREGNRPVFCVLDQTESWNRSNGGLRLAATMRRNIAKTNGSSIESPNAYLPGEGSVAEKSAEYWKRILDGKSRDDGLLYDHREAPADVDLTDHDSLLAGLRYAYGCSSNMPCVLKNEDGTSHDHAPGWVDLERLIAEIWDPDTDPQDARRYYLNQITHASDSYVSEPEWKSRLVEGAELAKGDVITLGFDGSRGRARGKPDATGLIATRLSDGLQVKLGGWEADEGPGMEKWQPPLVEIDAAWDEAFRLYRVAAAYADPAKDWRSKVDEWEAKYASKLVPNRQGKRAFVTPNHPFEWWMTGGRSVWIERAVLAYEGAIRNGEMCHNGDQQFTRHVLNARRRFSHQKLTIGKENDSSYKKVDLCVAAILSWQARMDAVALGIGTRPARTGRLIKVR